MKAEQQRTVHLNRSGGSRSVTVPKTWLRRIGVDDDTEEARLVLTEKAITIEPVVAEPESIEADPGFPEFMNFMLRSALLHPEALVNAADVFADDEDLVPQAKVAPAG
jgi:hypothetical protein